MSKENLTAIRELLSQCSLEEQSAFFRELRAQNIIHQFENVIGAPAEMILEAVHRAPELTRRMLRGVIADAAFRQFVVPNLIELGWHDVTPEGNFFYDYMLEDKAGRVTVQVKLQRSERGVPVLKSGARFGVANDVHMVETQKTRTGTDGKDNQTRPYRYEDFDILAVSMQPTTGKWDRYMYTLSRWLLPGSKKGEIATLQPVATTPNEVWTDNFGNAAQWFRMQGIKKCIGIPIKKRSAKKAPARKSSNRKHV